MALNHIHLKVGNVDSTRRFYEDHFGFRMVESNHVEAYLTDESGSWLTISLKNESEASLPDWFHFGFCMDSSEEVVALFQRLKIANARFSRELTRFGTEGTTFYVHDPHGNRVEVSWVKKRPLNKSRG